MDFKEYAEQFKARTAKRMADFELALQQSQRQMEELARQQARAKEMNIQKPPPMTPRGTYRGMRSGQIQGVLRRDGPSGHVGN